MSLETLLMKTILNGLDLIKKPLLFIETLGKKRIYYHFQPN